MLSKTDRFKARLNKWGVSADSQVDEDAVAISLKVSRFGLVDALIIEMAHMTPEAMADYYTRQFLYSVRDHIQEKIEEFERERWHGTTVINPTSQVPAPTPT